MLLARGLVLCPVGIDIGKGLVPFSLKINARIGQVTAKDGKQIVLDIARAQLVQTQRARENSLERLDVTGMLELKHRDVRLLVRAALARTIQRTGKICGRVAEHQFSQTGHVVLQLRLLQLGATFQAVVFQL